MSEILIQCKVISRPVFERQWVDDQPPLATVLQTLTEMMLWGASRAIVAVLVIDTFSAEYREFPIERHPGAESMIKELVLRFWEAVEAGKEPAANYARDLGLLSALYPPDDKLPPLDLTQDNRIQELLADREGCKARIKEDEEACESIDAEIVEKLAGATTAIANGWKISRKLQHRKEYIVPAKSFPVLRVSKTKEIRP